MTSIDTIMQIIGKTVAPTQAQCCGLSANSHSESDLFSQPFVFNYQAEWQIGSLSAKDPKLALKCNKKKLYLIKNYLNKGSLRNIINFSVTSFLRHEIGLQYARGTV